MRLGYGLILMFAGVMLGILIIDGRPPIYSAVQSGADSSFYQLFPTIDVPQEIIGIELVIPAESIGVAIETEGDQVVWHVRNTEIAVNLDAARAAQLYLANMVGIGQVHIGGASPEVLGFLPEARYVIRFRLVSDQVVTLFVGDYVPSMEAYYVSPAPDSAIVDLVPARWIDSFVMAMSNLAPIEPEAEDIDPSPDDSDE